MPVFYWPYAVVFMNFPFEIEIKAIAVAGGNCFSAQQKTNEETKSLNNGEKSLIKNVKI